MAAARVLQLLRSSQIYANFDAAKHAIEQITGKKDGEIILARYISGTDNSGNEPVNTYESAIGVYAATVNSTAVNHWTVFKSSTEFQDALDALQAELDATQNAVLGSDTSSYVAPAAPAAGEDSENGYDVIGTATSLNDAVNKIAIAIEAMDHNNNYTAGATPSVTDASKVIAGINQTDGKIDSVTTDAVDLLLTGYENTNASGAIAGNDTLENALSKLENATSAGVKISEKDGNQITRIENDATAANNGLYSHVELVTITGDELTALGTNVKEAYKLQSNGADITGSAPIKIYKDSALIEVYLGADTDTIDTTTGVITKNTVTDPQSLNFKYQLADGTYSLVKIDVSKFLTESEFGDGLQVSGSGVVSAKLADGLELTNTGTHPEAIKVKKDVNSEQVYTAASTAADVLTVGADGVKVANVQAAISYATQQVLSTTVTSSDEVLSSNTKHISVTPTGPDTTTGLYNYAISETDIASEDLVNTLTGQTLGNAMTYSGTRTYIGKGATNTITSDLEALDTAAANGLDGVVGSNAIAVGDKTAVSAAENPKTQTISLILDGTTVGNGQESTGDNNALSVTSNGLFLSNVWDCGQY